MNDSQNPYLRRVAHSLGLSDQNAQRAVEVFVRQKSEGSESLEALALNLGIARIEETKLPYDGGIFRDRGGRLVIKINSYSPPSRRRFTLAHEIAHLLLGTVPGLRSTCKEDPALERACDCVAAELLMPTESATALIRTLGPPSPENLETIATSFGVSLYAAAIRVHYDFRLWRCCIGSWERKTEIRKVWFVGRTRWEMVEPDTDSFDLALRSQGSISTSILWGFGSLTEIWINLLRVGKNRVVGLLDLA